MSKEYETHPAFGMIGAYRTSISPPGAVLFDSDVQHQHTVVVRIQHAERARDLHHDWIHGRKEIIEIEMSEAQWASFVSSMNTAGVPCTLRNIQGEDIERLDYKPRLEESMKETREAAHRAAEQVAEAFAAYKEKKTVANLRHLEAMIANMPANVEFAAKSLSEHAENVVQRARADIEAMVAQHAAQLGIEAPREPLLLGSGEDKGHGLGR